MSVFDDMMDTLFSSAIGESATYTPVAGAAQSIIVVPQTGDILDTFSSTKIKTSDRALFEVRKSELPSPAKGDTVTYKGADFTIKSFASYDDNRLIWTLDCYPAG